MAKKGAKKGAKKKYSRKSTRVKRKAGLSKPEGKK